MALQEGRMEAASYGPMKGILFQWNPHSTEKKLYVERPRHECCQLFWYSMSVMENK
jgi:hypothetical protein